MLRRTADDTDPTERVVVANADQLLIVVALADPPPRTGLVDRALIAAYAGGLTPILCLTKTDLAPPEPFAAQFVDLDLTVVAAGVDDPLLAVADLLAGKITVLLGHSGVGKSTLVNRLVPEADRAVGVVTEIGKGRHTSTQSVALPLGDGAGSGWVIDTPGIRSFGLAHIRPDDVLTAFSDLAEAIEDCPRGCGHMGPPADPECALDTLDRARRAPRRRGPAAAGGAQGDLSSRMPSSSGGTRWPSAQRISTARLGPTAQMRQPQPVAARQVASSPLEHRPDHRHEFDTRRRSAHTPRGCAARVRGRAAALNNPRSTSSASRADVAALVMPTRRAKSSNRVVP